MTALAAQEQAKVNLERTDVRSTVNGYVTNLQMRVGDYANAGRSDISLVDSDSFWVSGYFEETKMGSFEVGDPASVRLMGYREAIDGHVESISRGIATSNAQTSMQGLPIVQAVCTWVRLAQRTPRLHQNRQGASVNHFVGGHDRDGDRASKVGRRTQDDVARSANTDGRVGRADVNRRAPQSAS